jgi:hypothetical protein
MNKFSVEINLRDGDAKGEEWFEVNRFESEDNKAHDSAFELAHMLDNAGIDAHRIRILTHHKPTFDEVKNTGIG